MEAHASRKPDRLVGESLRIAFSAPAYAAGFAVLAGVLPRGQGAGGRQHLLVPSGWTTRSWSGPVNGAESPGCGGCP